MVFWKCNSAASGIRRIRDELIAALSMLTCVRRVDSFGSVAAGSDDPWSDLDLIVSCEGPECTQWLAAAAIRSTKQVAFYRMFSGTAQPSGRYWFCNESPFHRLDVSFCSTAAHAAIREAGIRAGYSVAMHTEYEAHLPADRTADERLHGLADFVDVTPSETALGKLLYVYLETSKGRLRGLPVPRDIVETRAALMDAVAAQPVVGNSDVVRFVAYVDDYIQRSHHVVENIRC